MTYIRILNSSIVNLVLVCHIVRIYSIVDFVDHDSIVVQIHVFVQLPFPGLLVGFGLHLVLQELGLVEHGVLFGVFDLTILLVQMADLVVQVAAVHIFFSLGLQFLAFFGGVHEPLVVTQGVQIVGLPLVFAFRVHVFVPLDAQLHTPVHPGVQVSIEFV